MFALESISGIFTASGNVSVRVFCSSGSSSSSAGDIERAFALIGDLGRRPCFPLGCKQSIYDSLAIPGFTAPDHMLEYLVSAC